MTLKLTFNDPDPVGFHKSAIMFWTKVAAHPEYDGEADLARQQVADSEAALVRLVQTQ